jgi:hypothetical protein
MGGLRVSGISGMIHVRLNFKDLTQMALIVGRGGQRPLVTIHALVCVVGNAPERR